MMTTFDIVYTEVVHNTWTDQIVAETEDEATDIFLEQIKGTEPDRCDVTNNLWDVEAID